MGDQSVTRRPSKYWRYVYTLIVFAEVAVAILVKESRFGFDIGPWTPPGSRKPLELSFRINSYAHKWELCALTATLILLFVFWRTQQTDTVWEDGRNRWKAICNLALGLSFVFLAFAGASLMLGYAIPGALFTLLIALMFLVNDGATWRAATGYWKEDARLFCLFADIPVVVSFVCLFFFFWANWDVVSTAVKEGDDAIGRMESFLSGAIAFQWLASNATFVVLSWTAKTPSANKGSGT